MSKLMLEEMRSRLARLNHPQAFLASLSDSGDPQVRPVTLMLDGDSFYFATAQSSRKSETNRQGWSRGIRNSLL